MSQNDTATAVTGERSIIDFALGKRQSEAAIAGEPLAQLAVENLANAYLVLHRRHQALCGLARWPSELREDADIVGDEGCPGTACRLREIACLLEKLMDPMTAPRTARPATDGEGRLRSAVTEAIALLTSGTEYEKLHVAGILQAAIRG